MDLLFLDPYFPHVPMGSQSWCFNSIATSRRPERPTSNFQDVATGQGCRNGEFQVINVRPSLPCCGCQANTHLIQLASGNKATYFEKFQHSANIPPNMMLAWLDVSALVNAMLRACCSYPGSCKMDFTSPTGILLQGRPSVS